ncbi:transglycosylase domain-containing protein [Aureimonas mangrovi]|uniref:transglycosylase domain-containing protein n=1 Tax=Aureimonas mangrovi TaxID=2758041 RepID=UPI00163D9C1C|nr:PBP1A family penicillin-binding protein [Aureimonas mangrovi]
MALQRRQTTRIEPSFGGERATDEDDFSVSADDRAAPATAQAVRGNRRSRDEGDRGQARRRADLRDSGGGSGGRGNGGGGGGFFGRRPKRRRSFFGHLVRLGVIMAFWGFIAVAVVVGYFAMTLPQEAWVVPDRPPNVKIVSFDGELLADRGLTGGQAVSLDQMSPYIPQAVIAIEDRRFYDHFGVDPIGIARAFFENVSAGDTVQGGSTLTQQLAKNVFLTPDQTIQRKIQEAILSLWLEQRFSKDQILEMYLNRVYFGSGATGIQAAARRYFDKNAEDITLNEAATLAGLLVAPSRLSPVRNPEGAQARAQIVLQAMRAEGFITDQELTAARAAETTTARAYWTGGEHYAADMVMRDLRNLVPDIAQDVVVETTIDLNLEKEAETVIRETIDGATQNVTQGALVALDGTGAIRAIVGGRDYNESQFNRAVDAKRQPGSAFKPFVYETAMEYGWRPENVVNDAPTRIGNWSPSNYDNKFRGPVTIADAVASSLNTIAAQLTAEVGPAAVIDTAKRMGITSPLADNASIALGTSEVSLLELTGAFAPFANGGYQATPHLVNRVTTASGEVLYERGAEVPPVILTADIAGMMNAMLTRVVTSGTGRRAALPDWQAAGKTGTTQDFKDAWFVGYTANLTTGVWFGNDNGAPMRQVTGGGLPAQAWQTFMVAAHEDLPPVPLPGDYQIGGGEQQAPQEPVQVYVDQWGNYVDQYGNPLDQYGRPLDGGGMVSNQPQNQQQLPTMRGGQDEGYAALPQEQQQPYEPVPQNGGYAGAPNDPYGDGNYGGPPPEYGVQPGYEPPARVVRQDQLPPDAVLEGPANGGRSIDRSLFRGLFGG